MFYFWLFSSWQRKKAERKLRIWGLKNWGRKYKQRAALETKGEQKRERTELR